jgi:hypothetical protein
MIDGLGMILAGLYTQLVHAEVAMHGGSANKNIGDAFLLVWKVYYYYCYGLLCAVYSATQVYSLVAQPMSKVRLIGRKDVCVCYF